MPGTITGGKKAAETNKKRYGVEFYREIGRKGGQVSMGGGFANNSELAREAGRKGGLVSRKGSARTYVQVAKEAAQQKQEHKSWRERIGLK